MDLEERGISARNWVDLELDIDCSSILENSAFNLGFLKP